MAPTIIAEELPPAAHPMNGGDDENSYFHNSRYQKGVIDAAKGVIAQVVSEKLEITNPYFDSSSNPFRIVDFGCSTGPNTFFAMQNVVEAVDLKYKAALQEPPEYQVFFNDHVNNDFNVLFRSLPLSREYFAAGVPGSFYIRLFPKASLHLVHSSYALHWLSKVPNEIEERSSPAWNIGRIHYTGAERAVVKAYISQFEKDMAAFLSTRAQELVEGGLMVLQLGCPSKSNAPSTWTGAGALLIQLLGDCLVDMTKLGLISEEKVESFNVPAYFPSVEEWEKVIEANNCFSIKGIHMLNNPMNALPFDFEMTSPQVRASSEAMIKEHFGSQIVDELYKRYTKKLAENSSVFDEHKDVDICIVLKRKSN